MGGKNILGNKNIYSHSFHCEKLNEHACSVRGGDLIEHMSRLQGKGQQILPIIISRHFLSLLFLLHLYVSK